MTGVMQLVESTRPPVFGTKYFVVDFIVKPRVGDPFLFVHRLLGPCNTSDVLSVAVDSENGRYLIQTRNSIYTLEIIK